MREIKKVSSDEASKVIDTRRPLGLFYTIEPLGDRKVYVGIDNSYGDAWTEDFKTLPTCKKWLNGGSTRNAQGFKF